MRRGPGRETSNCLLAPGEGWEGNQPTSWRSIWHSRMGSRWQARHARRGSGGTWSEVAAWRGTGSSVCVAIVCGVTWGGRGHGPSIRPNPAAQFARTATRITTTPNFVERVGCHRPLKRTTDTKKTTQTGKDMCNLPIHALACARTHHNTHARGPKPRHTHKQVLLGAKWEGLVGGDHYPGSWEDLTRDRIDR